MSTTSDQTGAGMDPFELAQAELKSNTVPTPEDVLADVGPLAAVWFLRDCAYYAMKFLSATMVTLGDGAPADDSEPVRALSAVTMACGELDGACVLLGLLPPDYADNAPA